MLFSPIEDAPQKHYFFVTNMDVGKGREQDALSFANMDVGKGREQDALSFVRSSQDHQYSFIRTPRTNVSEAALSVQMFIGINGMDPLLPTAS